MDQEHRGLEFQFDAAAEIAPESSPSATVAARVTDLSPSGCYLEIPAPFEVRTPVLVKIFHSAEYFKAKAMMIDVKPTVGMGLAFRDVRPTLTAMHNQKKSEEEI